MKKIIAIFLTICILSITCLFVKNNSSDANIEEIFYKNIEIFRKNIEVISAFENGIYIKKNESLGLEKRKDFNYYNIESSLVVVTTDNKELNKEEIYAIQSSGCDRIINKLGFEDIMIYDGAVIYSSDDVYWSGIMYCEDDNKIEYMKSSYTKLKGVHICSIKRLKDDFYYVVMD